MGSNSQSLIIMLVLFAVMYFMLIRPQNKKDKQEKEMRSNLQVGDEIMTVGGIYGKVVRIREDRITIASGAEKTKLEITKSAVSQKITDEKAGKVVEDDKKSGASPKKLKRLGQKEEQPAEEAVAEVKEEVAEVAETAEEVVAEVTEAAEAVETVATEE